MATGFRSKFFNIYAQKFLPNIKEMEKKRQKRYMQLLTIETVLIFIIIYILMSFISPLFGTAQTSGDASMALLVPFMPFILYCCAYVVVTLPENWNKDFQNEVKSLFLKDLLKVFGDIRPVTDSYYVATMVGLTSSGILPEYDEREYDDAFIGTYNGVEYAVIESELKRIVETYTKHGYARERKVRVFKGVILAYPCYKRILAHTIITPKFDFVTPSFNFGQKVKSFMYAFILLFLISFLTFGLAYGASLKNNLVTLGYICITVFALYGTYRGIRYNYFERVRVEDVDFEKDYVVKSEDQVEGRYLVTTAFIDRFKKLQKIYATKNIKCAFWGNTITFAISTDKDMFELGSLYSSLTDSRVIEKFYDEITSIFDLIDLFKLNEDTKL